MEFNQIISKKLHSLFMSHGLKMTEQSNNIVKYELRELSIVLSHNPRENSNTLWVGRKHFNEVEIDDQIMREHFNSDLKFNNLLQEAFVNSVFLFFMGDGKKLLERDKRVLVSLQKFNEQKSSDYTANLMEQQTLEAANKAWKDGNYSDVIKYLEKVNKANLPASFKQKYKIAQHKLSS